MTADEKLDILLKEMQGFRTEMRTEMQEMKVEMQKMNEGITSIELHLKNVTDKNIELLAENYVNLANKLSEAITASNRAILCEVQVRMLTDRVKLLEKDVACLKSVKA